MPTAMHERNASESYHPTCRFYDQPEHSLWRIAAIFADVGDGVGDLGTTGSDAPEAGDQRKIRGGNLRALAQAGEH